MNKERCIKWNVKCEVANKDTHGMDCPLDNTTFCNRQVLKAHHTARIRRKYRPSNSNKGIID